MTPKPITELVSYWFSVAKIESCVLEKQKDGIIRADNGIINALPQKIKRRLFEYAQMKNLDSKSTKIKLSQ